MLLGDKVKKIICFLLLVASFNAYSFSPYWLGVGSTTRNFSSAQKDENGNTVKFGFNPTVFLGMSFPFFFPGTFLSPAIGYGKHSGQDDAKRSEIILQYHVSQEVTSFFLFQYGFSNTITKVSGKGGTVVLNNGGSTATFYTPDTAKTSYMASLDLGGEFIFTSSMGTRLQVSIDRFLSSKARRVSHIATLNYYF